MGRFRIAWGAALDAASLLELMHRGRFAECAAIESRMGQLAPGSPWASTLATTRVLGEARCGSPERAQALLRETEASMQPGALVGCQVEVLGLIDPTGAAELARSRYDRLVERRCVWPAGVAAVALARSRADNDRPAWLAPSSPAAQYWAWADALRARDAERLRCVAATLEASGLMYDAALALRDAGELTESYRRLKAMDARAVREAVGDELRRAGLPVPRRTRARMAEDGLMDTERAVCKLVATGARSREVAEELSVSVRTVETHLANIYQKIGVNGRVGLTQWWRDRSGM